jgi:hypothetical protein
VISRPICEDVAPARGENRVSSTPVRSGAVSSERVTRIEDRNLRPTIESLDALSANISHDAVAGL